MIRSKNANALLMKYSCKVLDIEPDMEKMLNKYQSSVFISIILISTGHLLSIYYGVVILYTLDPHSNSG